MTSFLRIRSPYQYEDQFSDIFFTLLLEVVADTRFFLEPFIPFVEPIFKLLFQLLQDVTLFDSKLKVLEVLKSLIEALGDKVQFDAYSSFLSSFANLVNNSINNSSLFVII
jgi:hypothetical protein